MEALIYVIVVVIIAVPLVRYGWSIMKDAKNKGSSKLARMARQGSPIAKKLRGEDASPPAPQPSGASTQPVAEKVVERQVLVARCKFCKELTPVDLEACKNCGGKGWN